MGIITGLLASLVSLVVGLVVGGLGIHVGAALIAGVEDFGRAVWTALFAALGAAVVTALVGWIPILGALFAPILALVVYLGVVNWQYPGGWIEAAGIAVVAWLAVQVVTALLGLLFGPISAVGIL